MKHVRIFLTEEEQWRTAHGYDLLSEADHAIPVDADGHARPACPRCNPEGYAALYARHKADQAPETATPWRDLVSSYPSTVDQLLTR